MEENEQQDPKTGGEDPLLQRTENVGAGDFDRNERRGRYLLYTRSRNVVYYILGVIEALLLFRLLFKLLAANPRNAFVDFIYSVSSILAAPFFSIFGNVGAARYVFEPGVVIAMLVYAFIAAGVVKLVKISALERA